MKIENNSALVAGGASGLGAATVRWLHAAGAHVTIADLNEEKGNELVQTLGDRATFVKTDVTDVETVTAAIETAASQGDGLRIVVCCAGVGWAEKTVSKRGPHQLLPFETVLKVNLIGTFNVLTNAAAVMVENEPTEDGERGVIVNTASIAAFEGQVGQLAYAASKGGIASMTLPAARDLSTSGVRVCTIAPGLFDTPLLAALPEPARESLAATIPFPNRFGSPNEYAALAGHIIENQMLNGETVRLDGALRMAPR